MRVRKEWVQLCLNKRLCILYPAQLVDLLAVVVGIGRENITLCLPMKSANFFVLVNYLVFAMRLSKENIFKCGIKKYVVNQYFTFDEVSNRSMYMKIIVIN